jgi:hypothetical protein
MPRNHHPSLLPSLCAALMFVLAAFLGSSRLHAQDTKPAVEEPQYIGEFASIGPDGKLVALEKEKVTYEAKSHNHFVSVSVTSDQVVPNAKSPVRVASAAHFVVHVNPGSDAIDPSTYLSLRPFVVKKDSRTIPMNTAKAGAFQGVKSTSAADTSIAVSFKKYGVSSLEIVPSQPLPPGEYVLAANGGGTGVYCFGVDAP